MQLCRKCRGHTGMWRFPDDHSRHKRCVFVVSGCWLIITFIVIPIPPRFELPKVHHPKFKVILIWTKWFGQSQWDTLPEGMLSCAQYDINVSCRITYNKQVYERAHMVVFHGRGYDFALENLPKSSQRLVHQRWVYFTREPPVYSGLLSNPSDGKKLNGLFNWTMTFKLDSDIDYRYFRIVPGKHPDEYSLSPGKELAVAVVGNCRTDRLNFIDELQKYITVHVYGKCGDYSCPKGEDCFSMLQNRYKFYLSFENSVCKDYVTEKFYRNALLHNMLPVVINGGNFNNPTVAPPGCCIIASNFKGAKELAEYMMKVANNSTLYYSYFKWHSRYTVKEDLPTDAFCRACHKLYTDSQTKVCHDLYSWYGVGENCRPYPVPYSHFWYGGRHY